MKYVLPILLGLITPTLAQQPSSLDPNVQLAVCQDMRAVYISDSEKLQTLLRQVSAKISALQAERDALAVRVKEANAAGADKPPQ